MATKYVYLFNEGNANMRELLGGKGANLAEMTNIGLPVPYGFTITTEACTRYYDDGKTIADEIVKQIYDALAVVEEKAGKKFGDLENPYLVSSVPARVPPWPGHDGHHFEPGPQRRGCRRPSPATPTTSALLMMLSPLHRHVLRRS